MKSVKFHESVVEPTCIEKCYISGYRNYHRNRNFIVCIKCKKDVCVKRADIYIRACLECQI